MLRGLSTNQTASFRRSGSCMADLIGREIVQQVSAAEGIISKELVAASGKYLERSTVQSWKQKMRTAVSAAKNANRDWEDELYEAQVRCSLDNLRHEALDVRSQAGETVPGIVWASTHRLAVRAERGYLTSSIQLTRPITKNGSFLHGWCGQRLTSTCLARALWSSQKMAMQSAKPWQL